ncbi:MAG: ATP-binding protein [Halioglobus sp.]|nr:ATP-binding protein [Halioglobus sp.]
MSNTSFVLRIYICILAVEATLFWAYSAFPFVFNLSSTLALPLVITLDAMVATLISVPLVFVWAIRPFISARTTQLQKTADELTHLIHTANAPIFGIDLDGNVNEWNQQSEKITGYSKSRAVGLHLSTNFIADEHKAAVEHVLLNALDGIETANFEFPLLTRYGHQVDVLLSSTIRRDDSGTIIGALGVGQDITELNKVRLEQERERKEASAQIIQASKLATLGEMATSVAHELNQPLSIARMSAESIRRKIVKGTITGEFLEDKLQYIEDQTARAAAIIEHMRMFGREATEEPELIDPRDVVKNALALMGEQLRLDGVEVETDFSKNCPPILGHTIQMEQVIINLLTNARDAMHGSSGLSKVILRIFAGKNHVYIESEDSGSGIPANVLPRIFEPFFTTKEIGSGTGLGLSVSYGIIRDMKGTITAVNTSNGACFTITLPHTNYGYF